MNIPTFEPSVLYHLLKYWHQILVNVNASNHLHRTLSALDCPLSSNFCMASFPQNVPETAGYTPCYKQGCLFEGITD